MKLSSQKLAVAAQLVRALALRQRMTRSSPLLTVSIAGKLNILADVASRSFRKCDIASYALNDDEFFRLFSQHYPAPQGATWKMVELPKSWITLVIDTILGHSSTLDAWTRTMRPERNTGKHGVNTPKEWDSVPSSMAPATTPTKRSWGSLQGSGEATTVEGALSGLKQLRKPLGQSPRPSLWTDAIGKETP